jgi:hypothetical protein
MDLNADLRDKMRRARDKLAEQLHNNPQVTMVDVGYDIESDEDYADRQIVLRVHLSGKEAAKDLHIPDQVDGIPVRIITANYRLE